MNQKIPRINAQKLIKVLEKLDFKLIRQSGSHRIYKDVTGTRITVPYHSNKIIHPKIIKNILIDTRLTIDKFKKLIKSIIL